MRHPLFLGATVLAMVSALAACGSSTDSEPTGQAGSSSGSGGATAGSAGAAAGVSGAQAGSGAGGSAAGSGGATAGAGVGTSGGTNQGGASSPGGQANEAGAPGAGGASADPCGGCDAPDEVCVYQTGGPGASRFTCAAQLPCAAPGACACIVDQGQCGDLLMGEPPNYCVCDNGLD